MSDNTTLLAHNPSVPFAKMRSEIELLLEAVDGSQGAYELYEDDIVGHIDVDSAACAKYDNSILNNAISVIPPTRDSAAIHTQNRAHYVPALDMAEVRIYSPRSAHSRSAGALVAKMASDFGQFSIDLIFVAPLRAIATIARFLLPIRSRSHINKGGFVDRTPARAARTYSKTRTSHPALGSAIRQISIARLVRIGIAIWAATIVVSITLFTQGLL